MSIALGFKVEQTILKIDHHWKLNAFLFLHMQSINSSDL